MFKKNNTAPKIKADNPTAKKESKKYPYYSIFTKQSGRSKVFLK